MNIKKFLFKVTSIITLVAFITIVITIYTAFTNKDKQNNSKTVIVKTQTIQNNEKSINNIVFKSIKKKVKKAKCKRLTKQKGVNYCYGRKETYYSQRVLSGGVLRINGRHIGKYGTIRDKNNYIVVASDKKWHSKIKTSLGMGKVYDRGVHGNHIDIYTNW